jgi:hypothetical protein
MQEVRQPTWRGEVLGGGLTITLDEGCEYVPLGL